MGIAYIDAENAEIEVFISNYSFSRRDEFLLFSALSAENKKNDSLRSLRLCGEDKNIKCNRI